MCTTTAALLSSVLLLAGCTGDSDDGGGGGSSSTDDEAASWQDTEACEILAEDEVTDLLGQDHPEPEASDRMDRPTCEWQDPAGLTSLRIVLWDPPLDEVANNLEDETVDVGEHTGYVSTQSDISCDLNVETDTATVGVELTLESEQLGEDEACEVAADTAETVIGELGW